MGSEWHTKKWLGTSLHILFWAMIFSFPYLLRPIVNESASVAPKTRFTGFYYVNFTNNLIRLALFYANAYLFIPRLIYKRRYVQYVLALLCALGIMLVWDRLFVNIFMPQLDYKIWNFFVFNLPFFSFIVLTSAAFRIIRDRVQESQRTKERETENLKSELAFLRSQVSPHFMFNVLNNMVALARKKSDLLEPSLIKLSSQLRYMLYETGDSVPLRKEMEYLESYIDLQRQRFGNNMNIKVSIASVDDTHEIAPMLLIPFVENAFKHGPGPDGGRINIDLRIENNTLQFVVGNTLNELQEDVKDKTSGIGLANVQRRLALLYPDKHKLLVTKQAGWFIASLQIELN